MAKPLQYQSQYIPTNFNQVGNILGMFRQDMQQRNQEYDQGVAMEQNYLAQLAQAKTSDPAERNRLMQDLQSRVGEAVQRKGGDYGAAASDIGRLLANERSNPWYQYDTDKLAKMQEYSKLQKQKGLDFYATKDPSQVTLEDYLADSTSLDFDSYDLSQLDKMAALKAKEKATEMMRSVNNPVDGMMREIGNVYGFDTQAEGEQFLAENPNFLNDIAQSYGIDDPTVISRMGQVALTEMVGKRDTRFVADQEAIYTAKAAQEANKVLPNSPGRLTTQLSTRVGANLAPLTKSQLRNTLDDPNSLASAYGIQIRKKIIENNSSLKSDLLLEGLDADMQDITIDDINSKIRILDDQLRDTNFDANSSIGKELKQSKVRLNKAKSSLKSNISTYYDDETGDYMLPTYGYDDSLEGAKTSSMEPAKYFKYINDVSSAMDKTLSKYILGEDLILEGGDYDEKLQQKVREEQFKGEDLKGDEKAFADLKKEGGLKFVSVLGNSFTGVKFLLEDKNGNQHVARATDNVVFNNLMKNLDLPELKQMEKYKEEVRTLVPNSKIGKTNYTYKEDESGSPYLSKADGIDVSYGDYADMIDNLRLLPNQKEAIINQLVLQLQMSGEDINSTYKPGENNQYKLIQLSKNLK